MPGVGLLSNPRTRNTTYTAGTPVKSGDLDDVQDALIADDQLLRVQRFFSIPMMLGTISQEPGSPGALTFGGTAGEWHGTFSLTGGIGNIPLPIVPGDRVLSVRISYDDSMSAAPTPSLIYTRFGSAGFSGLFTYDPTGDGTASPGWKIQRWLVTVPKAMWRYSNTPGTPSNNSWGQNAVLQITAGLNSSVIYGVEVCHDTLQPVTEAS